MFLIGTQVFQQRLPALIDIRKWFACVIGWCSISGERIYMVCAWWSAPTFQHILSTGGCTVWCPHLPDLSTVDFILCVHGNYVLWLHTASLWHWIKNGCNNTKGCFKHVLHAHCCIRSHRGHFVRLVWKYIPWVCTGSNEDKTQHLKFQKGNKKWLRMEAFPDSGSHNIACLCFVFLTFTVVLDLWLLNGPYLHMWTHIKKKKKERKRTPIKIHLIYLGN
jgi:hypothetical protein